MIPRPAAILCVALLALAGRPARADDIPPDKRALIFLRVLAYDRNLAHRTTGDAVRIAVLYRVGDERSEHAAADLTAAINVLDRSVAGRPVGVLAIPFADSVARDLERAGVTAVFVCPGLGGAVKSIADATRKRAVLSFTQEEELVKAGISIGLVRRGDRAAILVNLAAARAEGADLSAELLRLAEVQR